MDLFGPTDFDYGELKTRLAKAAAGGVLLGTSSWKYPGWCGTVYDEQRYLGRGGKVSHALFEQACLAEYAILFPTVCVDAAYYRFPIVDDLLAMVRQVPETFQFTFKVTADITIKRFPSLSKHGSKAGTENPHFLDANLFANAFIRPCEMIASQVGMLIFEFSPFDSEDLKQSGRLLAALDRFLRALPTGWRYGVEIRNEELLTPEYFAVLASHGVTHIFNSWARMPAVGEQLAMQGSITQPGCVGARLLLKPGRKYEEAVDTFSPYASMQEPLPELRKSVAQLIRHRLGRPRQRTFLYFNNRLEGNAPRSISAVLELVEQQEQEHQRAQGSQFPGFTALS